MDLIREKQRARGHHRAMGGGDSSSASTQNTEYTSIDNRSVVSTDSHDWTDNSTDIRQDNRTNTNIDSRQDNRTVDWANSGNTSTSTSSTTNITATDFGSVQAGSTVSIEALKQNSTNTQALFNLSDKLFSGTRDMLSQNTQLAENLSEKANKAYEGAGRAFENATAQATGNKTMIYVAMAVVGVVAVMSFYKK